MGGLATLGAANGNAAVARGYGELLSRLFRKQMVSQCCAFCLLLDLLYLCKAIPAFKFGGRAARRAPTRKVRENLSRRSKGESPPGRGHSVRGCSSGADDHSLTCPSPPKRGKGKAGVNTCPIQLIWTTSCQTRRRLDFLVSGRTHSKFGAFKARDPHF